MKKILYITLVLSLFISCKNEVKSTEITTTYSEDELTIIKGEFVYFDDAAVLQSNNKIYGVFMTDKVKELNKKIENIRTKPSDVVFVEIKGKVSHQKDATIFWENKLEIIEIINVKSTPTKENKVVTLVKQ